jgi:hypothetical protein
MGRGPTCSPTTAISAVLEKKKLAMRGYVVNVRKCSSDSPTKPLKDNCEEASHAMLTAVSKVA